MAVLLAGFSLAAFMQVGGAAQLPDERKSEAPERIRQQQNRGRFHIACWWPRHPACSPSRLTPPCRGRTQFDWTGFVDRTGALLPLFGATMALTVGLNMIAVIICTLMLVRCVLVGTCVFHFLGVDGGERSQSSSAHSGAYLWGLVGSSAPVCVFWGGGCTVGFAQLVVLIFAIFTPTPASLKRASAT